MRVFLLCLTIATPLYGCSSTPSAEIPVETTTPSAAEPFVFVSDPAMKELMANKVEVQTEVLWNAGLEENAPKTDADWKKLEEAANGLIDAGKSMLEPPLAKDQGKWKDETQKFMDDIGLALKEIKAKNLTALNDTTGKMTEGTCTTCHKLYYTGPGN
jgi:hypothetical protein